MNNSLRPGESSTSRKSPEPSAINLPGNTYLQQKDSSQLVCTSENGDEYLETYNGTYEYFYLAANKFLKRTLELKVIKNPVYLYPDVEFRSNLMMRIKKRL